MNDVLIAGLLHDPYKNVMSALYCDHAFCVTHPHPSVSPILSVHPTSDPVPPPPPHTPTPTPLAGQ